MRSKRAVGLAVVSALLMSGLVGVLGVPASATDPAVLTVPSGEQRGVVGVTASADAGLYPFVQVGLVVGEITSVAGIPSGQLEGIDPVPVLNIGGTVNLQVPTWGVTDQWGTFVLMGCSTNNKATCTTPLQVQPRPIQQSAVASASFDVPTQPVFVPEEPVSITTSNAGGGQLVAWLQNSGLSQDLPNSGTTAWTDYPAPYGSESLTVGRCSTLVDDPAYCEPLNDTPVAWIEEFVPEQADADGFGLGFVTTDPSIPATSAQVTFTAHTMGQPYTLWWALRDANDDLVAGPVQIAEQSTAQAVTRTVSPIAHAVGAGIPDGDYAFVIYGSTSKGALTKQALETFTLTVLNDPPFEAAPLARVDRVQRPKDSARPTNTTAYFSVAALTDRPGGSAEFVIKNTAGSVVYDEQVSRPCVGYAEPNDCLTDGLTWDFRVPVGPDKTLLFPPGKYSVSARIPDQFGRLAPVALGALHVQKLVAVRKVVKVSVGKRLVSHGRLVKARFKLPMPEIKESYYDLSRTRITIGFKGTARRDRDRQVSCATTAGARKWLAYVPLESTGDQVCRLVNKSSFRGLPTRGVRVRLLVDNRAQMKVKWIKATYFFRGYLTPAS
jgi:hypothetical protein